MHLNWLAKIELKCPGSVVVSIIVNYCCTQKILKETKKTTNFFVIFLSLVALWLGVPRPLQFTSMMLTHRSMDLDYATGGRTCLTTSNWVETYAGHWPIFTNHSC